MDTPSPDDEFIIIACGKRRQKTLEELKAEYGDFEVVAPVERKLVRPRRKNSKTKPRVVERPLFYEYLAITYIDSLRERWTDLLHANGVLGLLLYGDHPAVLERVELEGMNFVGPEAWLELDGKLAKVVGSPLNGLVGECTCQGLELEMFGRKVKVTLGKHALKIDA